MLLKRLKRNVNARSKRCSIRWQEKRKNELKICDCKKSKEKLRKSACKMRKMIAYRKSSE